MAKVILKLTLAPALTRGIYPTEASAATYA
jgi:hypothetical protein